jgi:hypothetical protein
LSIRKGTIVFWKKWGVTLHFIGVSHSVGGGIHAIPCASHATRLSIALAIQIVATRFGTEGNCPHARPGSLQSRV